MAAAIALAIDGNIQQTAPARTLEFRSHQQ
jgi:hypothetical protein